jgi:hypothetical protein
MSIKDHAVNETSVLHLKDANDELLYERNKDGTPDMSKPMEVELYGPGSARYAKAQTASSNKLMDRLKRKGKTDQTAEEKAAENVDFLVALTKSMRNVDYDGLTGEALFRAVYADNSLGFIATQVNAYLGDWGNFTKAFSTR